MRDNERPALTLLVISTVSGAPHWAIYITSYNCPPQLSLLYDAHAYTHSIFVLTRAGIQHSVGILEWPFKNMTVCASEVKARNYNMVKLKGKERKLKERKGKERRTSGGIKELGVVETYCAARCISEALIKDYDAIC